MFSAAAALYAVVGLLTGLLVAAAALAIAGLILEGSLARDARLGGAGLGVVTAMGIAASVYLDALRAERLFVRAASTEIVAVALYLALMLALVFAGAGLAAIIAVSGTIPLISGLLCAVVARRAGLSRVGGASRARVMAIVPTAGWLLVIELCNLAMYASGRVILGAYKTPATVGLYEGPVRAHNLLYALGGALAVPVVPTASRYVAKGDDALLRELAVRGTRYTLALFVPVTVTLMVLAGPLLEVWLGERYRGGDLALRVAGVLLAALRGPGRDARVPRGRGPRPPGGADHDRGRRPQPGAGAGADTVARRGGAGAGHRAALLPGLPLHGRARPAGVGGAAGRPGGARVAAELPAGRRAGPGAAGLARARRGRRSWWSWAERLGPLLWWLVFYRFVLDSGERGLVRGLVRRPG